MASRQHQFDTQLLVLQARAHLLNVGLMAPAKDVSAVQINHMLGDVAGAHAGAGKVSEPDRTDIPRFLNRRVCIRFYKDQCFSSCGAPLTLTVQPPRMMVSEV